MKTKRYSLLKCNWVVCFVFFISLLLSFKNSFAEQGKIRVLFVGNSLTYVNDLPKMISQIAQSRNFVMENDMYAPGGYKLSQHALDPVLKDKINHSKWDFVVLQEQSQLPAFSKEQVSREVYPYAETLSQLIKQSNSKTRVVFYMTMALKDGDQENIKIFPELATYEGMQKKINPSYIQMAQQNQGILVPVGVVWQKVRSDKPELELYADDRHPSLIGTYLTACVFYSILFHDSPIGISYPSQIDEGTANYLQRITEQTVKSQSWDWL
ncbi:MAG: DUF4886 domain-containing protein [Candidatus Omnitrophota bacterium]